MTRKRTLAPLAASLGGGAPERLGQSDAYAMASSLGRVVSRTVTTFAISAILAGCLSEGEGSSDGTLVDEEGRRLELALDDTRVEVARHLPVTVSLEGEPWPEGARIEVLLDGEVRGSTEGLGPSWLLELPIRDERDDGRRVVVARATPLQAGDAPLASNEITLDVDVPPGGTIRGTLTLDHECWLSTLDVRGGVILVGGQHARISGGSSCLLEHRPEQGWSEFPVAGVPFGRVVAARLRPDLTAPWDTSLAVAEAYLHVISGEAPPSSTIGRVEWTQALSPSTGNAVIQGTELRLGASRTPERILFSPEGNAIITGWGRDSADDGDVLRGSVASASPTGDVRWNRAWPGPTPDTGEVVFFGSSLLKTGDIAVLSRTAGVFEVLLWSSDGDLVERFPVPGVTEIFEPGGFAATEDGDLFAVVGEIAPMYADDTELILIFDRSGSRFGSTRPSRDRTTARGATLTRDSAVFLRTHDCALGNFDVGELVDCTLEVEVRELDGALRWTRSFETLTPTGQGARGGDNGAALFVDRDGYVWIAASAYLAEPIDGFSRGFGWVVGLHP